MFLLNWITYFIDYFLRSLYRRFLSGTCRILIYKFGFDTFNICSRCSHRNWLTFLIGRCFRKSRGRSRLALISVVRTRRDAHCENFWSLWLRRNRHLVERSLLICSLFRPSLPLPPSTAISWVCCVPHIELCQYRLQTQCRCTRYGWRCSSQIHLLFASQPIQHTGCIVKPSYWLSTWWAGLANHPYFYMSGRRFLPALLSPKGSLQHSAWLLLFVFVLALHLIGSHANTPYASFQSRH